MVNVECHKKAKKVKNMKKSSDSRIVKVLGRIFNVRYWFDWERVKAFSLYLTQGFRQLFIPSKNAKGQSFKEATRAMHLNEEALLTKQKALWRLSVFMLVLAILIFIYTIYQLLYGSYHAMFVSLVVTLIALTLAFRYHFWYFQIKQKKLGCSIGEWFRQGVLGEKR